MSDCESYIPVGLIRAIICVMVFQTFVVSIILAWTTTRWAVSPGDVKQVMHEEAPGINEVLSGLQRDVDRLSAAAEEHMRKQAGQ